MPSPTHPLNIAFFGTPAFAAMSLNRLLECPLVSVKVVVTQPDRPAGRGQKLQESDVKVIANNAGIPVLQPENIRKSTSEFLGQLATFGDLDFAVVVAFGQILPSKLLGTPKFGAVNVHGSLLPRWRGAAPIQRAIMAGDKATGICIMAMDAGLDTGAVYSRAAVPIDTKSTTGTLHDVLALTGAKLLVDTLPKIASGECQAVEQEQEGITYAKKITPEECLIDWSMPASAVLAHVHGLSPFPGAFSHLASKRVKIFLCAPSEGSRYSETPGSIISKHGLLEVVCGDGKALSILELQLEGKKRSSAKDFLNGQQLTLEQFAMEIS
jgi:methionyl-tRNA formyltransferase